MGSILQSYTACNLTYASDRLVALQGVAQAFCNTMDLPSSAFVNGMWQPRFVDGLLWRRDRSAGVRPGRNAVNNTSNDCSWTWASEEGAIICPYSPRQSNEFHTCEILAVHGSHTASGHESKDISGWCRLRVPMCQVTLSRATSLSEDSHRLLSNYRLEVNGVLFREQQDFLLELDSYDRDWPPEGVRFDLYLLSMLSKTEKTEVCEDFRCLLVRAVDQRPGYFQRIGYFETVANSFAEPQTIDRNLTAMVMPQALKDAFRTGSVSETTGNSIVDGKHTITLI